MIFNTTAALKLFTAFLFFLFSGCVTQQTYINTENKSDNNKTYGNILLLHYGKDYEKRKTIENELAYWLRIKGYLVTPSVGIFENPTLPTREIISRILSENHFDGLLISRVRYASDKEMHADTHRKSSNYEPDVTTYYAWFDKRADSNTLGYSFSTRTFYVEARLFDAGTEKVVYSILSKSYDSDSFDLVVDKFSKSIAKSMGRSKLLKRKEIGNMK